MTFSQYEKKRRKEESLELGLKFLSLYEYY